MHLPLTGDPLGWADRLAAAATAAAPGQAQPRLTLSLDGPYGPSRTLGRTACKRLLIIAGGAGIGPCMAHYRHLYLESVDRGEGGGTGAEGVRVHLLWISRDNSLHSDPHLAATLRAVQENNCGGRFSFSLYTTRAGVEGGGGLTATAGRPDLAGIFLAMGQWDQQQRRPAEPDLALGPSHRAPARPGAGADAALVYASGPPPLLDECRFHAKRYGLTLLSDSCPGM